MSADPDPGTVPSAAAGGAVPVLGDRLLDEYLAFVAARCRPNTALAVAFDLRVFFRVVARPVVEVTTSDVLDFVTAQRAPRRGNVVRIADGESGMAASTIKRRLASAAGLFSYLVARGLVQANPVPRGLAARRPGACRWCGRPGDCPGSWPPAR